MAETLLGLHGPEDPEHVPELARHAWAAVPVMGAEAALPNVLAAADHAMARLAYEQAEQQLRRALQLLESLPPSAERTRRELGVRVRLGRLLGELRSPGSPEAAAAFARAAELAAEVADDPAALPALAGVHEGYIIRAEFDRARALAERVLDTAQRSGDPQALLTGHFLLGHTLSAQGELAAARQHLQEAQRLVASMPEPARLAGIPLVLGAAGMLETVLLLLGLPEQATQVVEAASRDLQRAPHPYPKAAAMTAGVYAAVHRRDPQLLRARAAAAAELCERWGFQMLAASATAPLGWAQAIEGDPAGGASLRARRLRVGRRQDRRRQRRCCWPCWPRPSSWQAGQRRRCVCWTTRSPRPIAAGSATSRPSSTGSRARACSPPQAAQAEAALTTAIAVARRQGAKLLEDRAAASLGRLRTSRQAQSAR